MLIQLRDTFVVKKESFNALKIYNFQFDLLPHSMLYDLQGEDQLVIAISDHPRSRLQVKVQIAAFRFSAITFV